MNHRQQLLDYCSNLMTAHQEIHNNYTTAPQKLKPAILLILWLTGILIEQILDLLEKADKK